jgi:hypothetical protein
MTRQALQAKESAPAKKSSFSWLRPAAAQPAAEEEHEAPSASSHEAIRKGWGSQQVHRQSAWQRPCNPKYR